VKSAGQPVPLEALADRAVRTLGHDRTVGTGWAGAGSFSNLLTKGLPAEIRLSDQAPYYVFDASRQLAVQPEPRRAPAAREPAARIEPPRQDAARAEAPRHESPRQDPYRQEPTLPLSSTSRAQQFPSARDSLRPDAPPAAGRTAPPPTVAPAAPKAAAPRTDQAPSIQQSITRIHDACQAPPLAPPEYRALFEVMAQEINSNGLTGAQTLTNITHRAADLGVTIKRDDVRFVLEVVSETDPWFEQGASPNLFATS